MKLFVIIDGKEFISNTHNIIKLMKLIRDADSASIDLSISIVNGESDKHNSYQYERVRHLNLDYIDKSLDEAISKYDSMRVTGDKLIVLSMTPIEEINRVSIDTHYIYMDSFITNRVYALIETHMVIGK